MMRFFVRTFVLLCGVTLVSTSCSEETLPEARNQNSKRDSTDSHPPVTGLTYHVVDGQDALPGGGVRLAWYAPAEAVPDDYVVSVDGVDLVPTNDTYYDVFEPGAELAVYARYQDERSEPRTLFFGAKETKELTLWASDYVFYLKPLRTQFDSKDKKQNHIQGNYPRHPATDTISGFGFDASGKAWAYDLGDTVNWPFVDYYIVDFLPGIAIAAPDLHEPALNEKMSGVSNPISGTEYENYKTAESVGYYYNYTEIAQDGLYSLMLTDSNEISHFAKVMITNMEDAKVSLKLAFQPVPELRWLVVGKSSSGIEE